MSATKRKLRRCEHKTKKGNCFDFKGTAELVILLMKKESAVIENIREIKETK